MIIVCENAINYNSMEQAKLMILKAKEITERTGVKTLSKFQLFSEKEVVNKEHLEYCKERMLTFKQAKMLFDYGVSIGQTVFFTPMAEKFVDWCEEIGVEYYKIRHYDQANLDIINKIIKTKKPYFISKNRAMTKFSPNEIDLFCIPNYPARIEDYLKEVYNFMNMRGISDHSPFLELLQIAKVLGIEYFERHITLTKENCLESQWCSTFEEVEVIL